jgi:transposase-like protein
MRATYQRFPQDVQEAAARRYLTTDLTQRQVAEEFGASSWSIRTWVHQAQERSAVAKKSKRATNAERRSTEQRSAEEKLRLLLEARALTEEQLGEFLRREGLHDGDLERWRAEALGGLGGQLHNDADRCRIAELERAALKQHKRLREAEALLELQKKVQALWGEKEDDTTED